MTGNPTGAAARLPRLLIAGLRGDAGKTLLSLGLTAAWRRRGLVVAPYKKGPDYIDAAWLEAACGRPGRNLDTFLMPPEAVLWSLRQAVGSCELALIEGNRGLYDGLDARGSHSSAALARLTATPVVLVVDCTKATRTVAALVLGAQQLEPDVRLAGVILNRVGTARQEQTIRRALADACPVPVLGALPRLDEQLLPARHLGLLTAREHPQRQAVLEHLAERVAAAVDLDGLQRLARGAESLPATSFSLPPAAGRVRARLAVLEDEAFTFYYPENLEALQRAGAELVPLRPRRDTELPAVDGLLVGGGFPERHAAALADNAELRRELRRAIAAGLPVWAECGGLMYLARQLVEGDRVYPMVGALPFSVRREARPQGHGYVAGRVTGANPFLPAGTEIRGHEFHYSRLEGEPGCPAVLELERGQGIGGGRDWLVSGNLLAGYTHVHALGLPGWAEALVDAIAAGRGQWCCQGGAWA